MKKILPILYCAAFFGACLVPGLGLLRPPAEMSTAEKRPLAAFPALRTEDGWDPDFAQGFSAYVSDHFGGREQLVAADSRLKYALLQTSSAEDVIVGTDGWLYYAPTVRDFQDIATVSPLGIQNIVHNLELMQAYAEAHGSRFAVMVVPNKNTICPEHMPGRYIRSGGQGNLENLREAVEQSTVQWIPLTEALKNADVQPYHKTDTHWNNAGALAGYECLMRSLGRESERFRGVPCTTENSWEGDLALMLFPDNAEPDEQQVYAYDFTYRYLGRYRDSDDITIQTSSGGEGSLLMFRDSFGAAIIPYLSEEFAQACYSRARPNPLNRLETGTYDTVVLEIVERNIAWLQQEAPLHPAMPAEPPAGGETGAPVELHADTVPGLVHLYGRAELPDAETAPLCYVTLTGPAGEVSYRAYNCCEPALAAEGITDDGWSLYIPADTLTPGTAYEVTLILSTPARTIRCSAGTYTAEPA